MVDAMDRLTVGWCVLVTRGWWKEHQLISWLYDLHFYITDLRTGPGAPGAPIAYVIMVVVVMMVVMDQMMDGGDSPLALAAPTLSVHDTIRVDLFPPLVLPVII